MSIRIQPQLYLFQFVHCLTLTLPQETRDCYSPLDRARSLLTDVMTHISKCPKLDALTVRKLRRAVIYSRLRIEEVLAECRQVIPGLTLLNTRAHTLHPYHTLPPLPFS